MSAGVEDDEEAQQRGIVGCLHLVGGGIEFDLQRLQKNSKLANCAPSSA
jgi:hypothetical protein